jgi:septal ring factor EnvC (AmiA/AmiB activator)
MATFTENVTSILQRKVKSQEEKIEELENEISKRIIENAKLNKQARQLWEENQKLKGRPSEERDGWQPKR